MAHEVWRHALVGAVAAVCFLSTPSRAQTGTATAVDRPRGISPPADSLPECITGDSLLDAPAMRELLRLLWSHSLADGPAAERRERAGFLFDSVGVLVYRADLDHPRDTPCASFAIVSLCGNPVAAVFTHPFRPGEVLPATCHPGDHAVREYAVDRFGGASESDLDALLTWRLPGYVLDKEHVYAIPRGTTPDNALAVVKRYPRVDRSRGCRIM